MVRRVNYVVVLWARLKVTPPLARCLEAACFIRMVLLSKQPLSCPFSGRHFFTPCRSCSSGASLAESRNRRGLDMGQPAPPSRGRVSLGERPERAEGTEAASRGIQVQLRGPQQRTVSVSLRAHCLGGTSAQWTELPPSPGFAFLVPETEPTAFALSYAKPPMPCPAGWHPGVPRGAALSLTAAASCARSPPLPPVLCGLMLPRS